MRIALPILAAVLSLSAPAFAGDKEVFCPPGKATCEVPTVDIQANVQADGSNNAVTNQNAGINMQGTVQAGHTNRARTTQTGRVNVSGTAQGQR